MPTKRKRPSSGRRKDGQAEEGEPEEPSVVRGKDAEDGVGLHEAEAGIDGTDATLSPSKRKTSRRNEAAILAAEALASLSTHPAARLSRRAAPDKEPVRGSRSPVEARSPRNVKMARTPSRGKAEEAADGADSAASGEENEQDGADGAAAAADEENQAGKEEDEEADDGQNAPAKTTASKSKSRSRRRKKPKGRPLGIPRNAKYNTVVDESSEDDEEVEIDNETAALLEEVDEEGYPLRKMYKGKIYDIVDKETVRPLDIKGEEKISLNGRLLGGREFVCSSFTLPDEPKEMIMGLDAAKSIGYRDAYYLFLRKPLLIKIELSSEAKEALIAKGVLTNSFRNKQTFCLTARSFFLQFGSKVIKNGRLVIDDYYEENALEACKAAGKKPGDLAIEIPIETAPRSPSPSQAPYPAAALAFASATSRGFGGRQSMTTVGKIGFSDRNETARLSGRKLDSSNWMYEYARNVAEFNRSLAKVREELMVRYPSRAAIKREKLRMAYAKNTDAEDDSSEEEEEEDEERGLGQDEAYQLSTRATSPDEVDADQMDQEDIDALNKAQRQAPPFKLTNLGSRSRQTKGLLKESKRRRIARSIPQMQVARGYYEPHTHVAHFPADTQPTKASWERLSTEPNIDWRSRLAPKPETSVNGTAPEHHRLGQAVERRPLRYDASAAPYASVVTTLHLTDRLDDRLLSVSDEIIALIDDPVTRRSASLSKVRALQRENA